MTERSTSGADLNDPSSGTETGGAAGYHDLTDEALIRRMATQEEGALAEMHQRYARLLHALGLKMLRQHEDVESCVQDAFLNMWNHAPNFDPARARAKTWLVSIAHHRFLQELRDRPDTSLALEEWDAPVQGGDPTDTLMTGQAMSVLDDTQRRLVEWAYFRGHTHAELAQLTGWPLGTVKSRLRAALDRMRTALGSLNETAVAARQPRGGEE